MNKKAFPPILGYADRLSARPDDLVQVKVSSFLEGNYTAGLVRIISADPNPAGVGIVEEEVDCDFSGLYPARVQPFWPGSHMQVSMLGETMFPPEFTVVAGMWPTKIGNGKQVILAIETADSGLAFVLELNEQGRPQTGIKMKDGSWTTIALPESIRTRSWGYIWAACSQASGTISLGSSQREASPTKTITFQGPTALCRESVETITVAGTNQSDEPMHFNGKLERPTVYSEFFEPEPFSNIGTLPKASLFASWDFSIDMSSSHVTDVSANRFDGILKN